MDSNSLQHYGVLGMKWGVRRYQNYDGTYTQKGLKRYRDSESKYEDARKNYKSGKGTKGEVKIAKRQMKKNYKQLKKDKLADEGKALYSSGKTITENNQRNKWGQVGAYVGGSVLASALASSGNAKIAYVGSATVSVGATAISAALQAKTMRENKRLRAYYTHSGKPRY